MIVLSQVLPDAQRCDVLPVQFRNDFIDDQRLFGDLPDDLAAMHVGKTDDDGERVPDAIAEACELFSVPVSCEQASCHRCSSVFMRSRDDPGEAPLTVVDW